MATNTPTGSPVPTLGDAPNVPADMLRLAVFLDPVTIPRFTTTGNASTAFPTPYAGQMVNIAGQEYMWFEAGWRLRPQIKWGKVINRNIEGNGYSRVTNTECFFNGAAPGVVIFTANYPRDIITWTTTDGGGILNTVYNSDTKVNAPSGTPVNYSWLAFKEATWV